MKFNKKFILSVTLWFVVCLVITAIAMFIGTILLTFYWSFRSIFWPIFIWSGIFMFVLMLLWAIFIQEWKNIYEAQLRVGRTEQVALDNACFMVRCRLPKWLLRKMFVKGYTDKNK